MSPSALPNVRFWLAPLWDEDEDEDETEDEKEDLGEDVEEDLEGDEDSFKGFFS